LRSAQKKKKLEIIKNSSRIKLLKIIQKGVFCMAKPQTNCSWIKERFQDKVYQSEIFIGFIESEISDMTILINSFVESIDLSFFSNHYHSNEVIGGRPHTDYRIMLKIYLYALYNAISIRRLTEHYSLGSNLHYLSQGLKCFPKRSSFYMFLKVLDIYIDDVFDLSIACLESHLTLNTESLYCDGTIFEAHNSRYRIITDVNLERSNKKYSSILENKQADEETKETALKKLELNLERATKLAHL
jgi:transposase